MKNRTFLLPASLALLIVANPSIGVAQTAEPPAAGQPAPPKAEGPKPGATTNAPGATNAPETKKQSSAKTAPEFPPKTKMALRLAGLMTFIASSCPELQPDYARFKGAVGALGVTTADLDREAMKAAYLTYAMRYKEDRTNNCARALKDFGPGGSVVADLVKARAK